MWVALKDLNDNKLQINFEMVLYYRPKDKGDGTYIVTNSCDGSKFATFNVKETVKDINKILLENMLS